MGWIAARQVQRDTSRVLISRRTQLHWRRSVYTVRNRIGFDGFRVGSWQHFSRSVLRPAPIQSLGRPVRLGLGGLVWLAAWVAFILTDLGLVPGAVLATADYAELLTGEEAVRAAVEDGQANADGTLDGDFYIRNRNDRLRTLPVESGAAIVVYACYVEGPCLTREAIDVRTFANLRSDPSSAPDTVGWQWYGDPDFPCWLIIDDGVIVHIDEQYLP